MKRPSGVGPTPNSKSSFAVSCFCPEPSAFRIQMSEVSPVFAAQITRPSGVQFSAQSPSYLPLVSFFARPSSSFGDVTQILEVCSEASVTIVDDSAGKPKLVLPYSVRSLVILLVAPSGYETCQI